MLTDAQIKRLPIPSKQAAVHGCTLFAGQGHLVLVDQCADLCADLWVGQPVPEQGLVPVGGHGLVEVPEAGHVREGEQQGNEEDL